MSDKVWWLLLCTIVLVVILGGVSECRKSFAAKDCLKEGYPDTRASWGGLGAIYCVKRVNQTDVVVPAP